MAFFAPLLALLTFTIDYLTGFTQAEIFHKRIDVMSTIVMTLFIMHGFKPFFNFLKNSVFFLRDLFLGIFWPQKKLHHLYHHQTKVAYKKAKLEAQIQFLEDKKTQLETKIKKINNKHMEEK